MSSTNIKIAPNHIHICHLSSVHHSYDSRVFDKECVSLAKNGFKVTLIIIHDKSEQIEGVSIVPFKKYRSRFLRALFSPWVMLPKALKTKADLFHFHDPELMPLAIILKIFRKKVVMDVHDDVIDFMGNKKYLPSIFRYPIGYSYRFLQVITTKIIDAVVTATPHIAESFPSKKTTVVQNFPSTNDFQGITTIPYEQRNNIIIYSGLLHENTGFKSIVESSKLLPEGAIIQIIGKIYPTSLKKELESCKNIEYISWTDRKSVLHKIKNAKIGIALYQPTKQNIYAQPRKLFEYMAAGIPIIASDSKLWKEFVEENNAGINVDPASIDQIVEAVKFLTVNPSEAKQMGHNARIAFENKYDWQKESDKLVNLYSNLLSK
ncbi:MAG: glycosyltransferase family 4 protein [Crocinitomicaceae bacterium]|nr:glycosyltransferase family 4 protein [Crocinitomicaceae bacterium]